MSKLSFRARALDASKPMPIYLAEELPDLPDYSAINRAVPQMPSGMEKEEESEHHLQRAISGSGLIIPTPEVCPVEEIEFYERCYPPDYKMPKQHIHMQPLWEEQEAPDYDLDTEDEQWLKQRRHPELTALKFEQMMDKLEKSSGQTVVTLHEARLLLERSDEMLVAVYDYWLNKRLTTQHPLILSVKTEHRPGQSSNNPYLAFRRRTEKMQTRKNRKNDESSYEKMLKLRRDLARALTLLELVARRERAKRELVKLTALLAERRYGAGDFAHQLLPEPPARLQYTVPLSSGSFRREPYAAAAPHYAPRPAPAPADQPRQREKRTYKRRKHRHVAPGSAHALRDSGVYSSSEEESPRVEPPSPPDDGPFAFRRKPGCYYEMPTSTLCGDPVDPDSPLQDGMYQHEVDPRHRYTLTSLRTPYPRYVGFARRRACRGGRVALDRVRTPLDDLWPALPLRTDAQRVRDDAEEDELENKRHRTPKEITRDYHTSGKYPWRHAFRRHIARHPHLWVAEDKPHEDLKHLKFEDIKPCPNDLRLTPSDLKLTPSDLKLTPSDLKLTPNDLKLAPSDYKLSNDLRLSTEVKLEPTELPDVIQDSVKSDISVRTVSDSGKRKRSWSDCSDSSYDSDESLHPVEKEFEKFIDEVNRKWLHFRPKTPPPSPPQLDTEDQLPIALDTPLAVELRPAEKPLADTLDPNTLGTFTTSEFTLGDLYPDIPDVDNSGTSLEMSGEDLLGENFTGLTEDQVESILSETDLKSLAEDADKKITLTDELLDQLVSNVDKEPFLLQGQSAEGRADSGPGKRKGSWFGSSSVRVLSEREPLYCAPPAPPPAPAPAPRTPPKPAPAPPAPRARAAPAPAPPANIIPEEVNNVGARGDARKKEDTLEEVQLSHGVQLKTVQTVHSPLKKHIITSGARARDVRPTHVNATHVNAAHASGTHVSGAHASGVHASGTHASVAHASGTHVSGAHAVHATHAATTATHQPQIVTVAVSDSLKVRLQNHLLSSQAGVLVQNGPFPPVVAVPVHHQRDGTSVAVSVGAGAGGVTAGAGGAGAGGARRGGPLVALPAGARAPLVLPHALHVPPSKLKVLHAHPLTASQRSQLLAQSRLPAVLATLEGAARPVAQLFEIKAGQLGRGAHLVNVLRPPADRKRPLVLEPSARVAVSLDPRQIVRTGVSSLAGVRAAPARAQFQLKSRVVGAAPGQLASSVVNNLLHKNIQLPKGGQKIAISGGVSGNVQAIAFSPAHVKARQARLVPQPRAPPQPEIVEASPAGAGAGAAAAPATPLEAGDGAEPGAAVRRRAADTPMEVT